MIVENGKSGKIIIQAQANVKPHCQLPSPAASFRGAETLRIRDPGDSRLSPCLLRVINPAMKELWLLFLLLTNPSPAPAIVAAANEQVIDCQNKPLVGKGNGVGIYVSGRTGVVIKNCIVRGFELGLLVENSSRVLVRDSDFSGNFVDDHSALELAGDYPKGGILFRNVTFSTIEKVRAEGNLAGVQIIGGYHNIVRNNDLNKNRGWGIRLLNSPHNLISENVAIYNNRSCWSGPDSGCESAALAVIASDFTMVVGNTFNASGDGIYQGNTWERASNSCTFAYNILNDNVANGIEATFSHDNRFIGNEVKNNNYGFWLGYASYALVSGNVVTGNHSRALQADEGKEIVILNNEGVDATALR